MGHAGSVRPTGSHFPRTHVKPLLTLMAPDPPGCEKPLLSWDAGQQQRGSRPPLVLTGSRKPPEAESAHTRGPGPDAGAAPRAGRAAPPGHQEAGRTPLGSTRTTLDTLFLPVPEREPTKKGARDSPQGLRAASLGRGSQSVQGALLTFIQAAGAASKLQGGPPARGWAQRKTARSSSCRKGTRSQSQQPPSECQLGVTGKAQSPRGNAETQGRRKKLEKEEAGGHTPPISKLPTNCSRQDPLVLARGRMRDEETGMRGQEKVYTSTVR